MIGWWWPDKTLREHHLLENVKLLDTTNTDDTDDNQVVKIEPQPITDKYDEFKSIVLQNSLCHINSNAKRKLVLDNYRGVLANEVKHKIRISKTDYVEKITNEIIHNLLYIFLFTEYYSLFTS